METKIKQGKIVMCLKEDLVASQVEALAAEANLVLENKAGTLTDVVLDAGDINFIDSRGISFVVALYKTADQAGLGFSLTGLSKEMFDLCALMRLDEVFPISQR